MQLSRIALRSDRICAHSDCPELRCESSGWRPDPGPLSGGSSAILEMPRNPRNWVLGLFAILAQSCRLWFDCRFKAIMTQFRRIAANCHQSAPRIAPAFRSNRNRTRIDPDETGKKSAENARTAILTAIFTIEFNCGKIAKPRRIARGSP